MDKKLLDADDGVKYRDFNLNDYVKVKLTDLGYQRLADLHNQFVGIIPSFATRDASYYRNKADKDGYTELPFWGFMELYSEIASPFSAIYFDANIKIAEHKTLRGTNIYLCLIIVLFVLCCLFFVLQTGCFSL